MTASRPQHPPRRPFAGAWIETCQSAWGPDADRRANRLILLAWQGFLEDAYSQTPIHRMDDATYQHLLAIFAEKGDDPSKFVRIPQRPG